MGQGTTVGIQRPRTLSRGVSTTQRTAKRPMRTFVRLFGLFTGLFAVWALATPIMAVPDEPAHTIKAAAVVRGQVLVEEGTSFGHGVHVRVPDYIANLHAQGCYKFSPSQTADCAPPIYVDDTFETIGVTSAGSYNPLYYWIVGLPTLFLSGAPALFAMRLVSGLICAAFFAAGFTALTELRRPKYPVLLTALAMTPMVLFLGSGINPNSLEVAATMAAFAGFVVTIDNWRRPRTVMPAIVAVVVSTIVLANCRQISLVWLLCALVVGACCFRPAVVASAFKNKLVLAAVAVAIPGVLAGLYWIYVSMNGPANSGVAPDGIASPQPDSPLYRGFMVMLDRTFDFFPQYIGLMGWLDSPVPEIVNLVWGAVFVAVMLLPLLIKPMRSWTGYWVALAALILVPALLQTSIWRSMGFIWQGRYNLPLVLVLFMSVGLGLRRLRFPTLRMVAPAKVLAVVLVFCHTVSFAYVMRRYVVGIRDTANWQTLLTSAHWQPPLGWLLLTVIYAIIVVVGTSALYRYLMNGVPLFTVPSLHRRKRDQR